MSARQRLRFTEQERLTGLPSVNYGGAAAGMRELSSGLGSVFSGMAAMDRQQRQEAVERERVLQTRMRTDADLRRQELELEYEHDPDGFAAAWAGYSGKLLEGYEGELKPDFENYLVATGGSSQRRRALAQADKAKQEELETRSTRVQRLFDDMAQGARTGLGLDAPEISMLANEARAQTDALVSAGLLSEARAGELWRDQMARVTGHWAAHKGEQVYRSSGIQAARAFADDLLANDVLGDAPPEARDRVRREVLSDVETLFARDEQRRREVEAATAKRQEMARLDIAAEMDRIAARGGNPEAYLMSRAEELSPRDRIVMVGRAQAASIATIYEQMQAGKEALAEEREAQVEALLKERDQLYKDDLNRWLASVEIDINEGRMDIQTFDLLYASGDIPADQRSWYLRNRERLRAAGGIIADDGVGAPEIGAAQQVADALVHQRPLPHTAASRKAVQAYIDNARAVRQQAAMGPADAPTGQAVPPELFREGADLAEGPAYEIGDLGSVNDFAELVLATQTLPTELAEGFQAQQSARDYDTLRFFGELMVAIEADTRRGPLALKSLDQKTAAFWQQIADGVRRNGDLPTVAEAAFTRVYEGDKTGRRAERDEDRVLETGRLALENKVMGEQSFFSRLSGPLGLFASDAPEIPPQMRADFMAEYEARYSLYGSEERAADVAWHSINQLWGKSSFGGEERWTKFPVEAYFPEGPGSHEWAEDQLATWFSNRVVGGDTLYDPNAWGDFSARTAQEWLEEGRIWLEPMSDNPPNPPGVGQPERPWYRVRFLNQWGELDDAGAWQPDWYGEDNPHRAVWDRAIAETAVDAAGEKIPTVGQADIVRRYWRGLSQSDNPLLRSRYANPLQRAGDAVVRGMELRDEVTDAVRGHFSR